MFRLSTWLVAGVASAMVSLSAPALAQPAPAEKVLVFPFAALGEDARANADMLRRNLMNAIDLMAEVDVVDPSATEKTIGRSLVDARDSCGEDATCTAAIGKVAGVRWIVKGGVRKDAEGFMLSIQLFDVNIAETVKGPQTSRAPTEERAVESMRSAAQWLFATTGFLQIVSSVGGAEVFVDSRPVGKAPLARPLSVQVGKHNVRVEMAGFEPFSETVDVKPGAMRTVRAELAPKTRPVAAPPRPAPGKAAPTSLVKKPWFWAAAGAAVVAIGAGAAVAASSGGGSKTKTTYDDQDYGLPPQTTITW